MSSRVAACRLQYIAVVKLLAVVLSLVSHIATADPHAEMAASLVASADTRPGAAVLPSRATSSHPIEVAQGIADGAARVIFDRGQSDSQRAVRQAEAAATSAAAQERAIDAKMNHPHRRTP